MQVAEEVSKITGVSKVLLADSEAFKGFLPGNNRRNVHVVYILFNSVTSNHWVM